LGRHRAKVYHEETTPGLAANAVRGRCCYIIENKLNARVNLQQTVSPIEQTLVTWPTPWRIHLWN